MTWTPNRRMGAIALGVFLLDQFTKLVVRQLLNFREDYVVVDGFFKFVYWGNTGAAWSIFKDNNRALAVISLFALIALYYARHQFDAHTRKGQLALGLILGGIAGNILDRFLHGHVVDFLYFYLYQRSGAELGFPAFNVADSAICIGIGLTFVFMIQREREEHAAAHHAEHTSGESKQGSSGETATERRD